MSLKRIGDMASTTPRLESMVVKVYEKMVSAGARVGAIGKAGLAALDSVALEDLRARELALKEASELAKIKTPKQVKAKPRSRNAL